MRKKAPKLKTNNFHPVRSFCACKKLLPLLCFVRSFLLVLVGFGWFAFLYAQNLFVKEKKTNLDWNSPDSLIYYTTEIKLTGKSFIYIKKRSGGRGTPASIFAHFECWPFKTTLCFLSFRELVKVSSKLLFIPFCFNL